MARRSYYDGGTGSEASAEEAHELSLASDNHSGSDAPVEACPPDHDISLASSDAMDCDSDSPLDGLDVDSEAEVDLQGPDSDVYLHIMEEGAPVDEESPSKWWSPLARQSQRLIGHFVCVAEALPRQILKELSRVLGVCKASGSSVAVRLAARFFQIPRHTVDVTVRHTRKGSWVPVPRATGTANAGVQTAAVDDGIALQNLVRLALSNASEGRSGLAFEREVVRLQLAYGDVGDKNHSRHFARQAEHIAVLLLRQLDAVDFNTPLDGLGVPSDFGLMFDPVSIGVGNYTRTGTVLMTNISVVSRHTYRMHTPMLAAPTMGLEGHTGDALATLTLEALSDHPAGFATPELKARLAVIGGDGQVTQGGENARHPSTKAAEKLWRGVHSEAWAEQLAEAEACPPPPIRCVQWDNFHRVDIAAMRAVKSSPAAKEVFEVASTLVTLFGVGEGRALLRGVAAAIAERPSEVQVSEHSTRKIGHLSGVPGNVLNNFKSYVVSLRGRLAWTQSGHSAQKAGSLVEINRRLCNVAFVVFASAFNDVLVGSVRPYALLVQGASEPWRVQIAEDVALAKLAAGQESLDHIHKLATIIVLCAQHLHPLEFKPYLEALSDTRVFRRFPLLMKALAEVLCTSLGYFHGCELHLPHASLSKEVGCYGAHCQCVSAAKLGKMPEDRRVLVSLGKEGKQVKVPVWVAYADHRPTGPHVPRHQTRDRCLQPVPGFQSKGAFRQRLTQGGSRCHVPEKLYHVLEEVQKAIHVAKEFSLSLKAELGNIFGPEGGVNAGMHELLQNCRVCWDWGHLLEAPPTGAHVKAFLRVVTLLRPFLLHTRWPDRKKFPSLQRNWDLSDTMLGVQYMILMKRVRLMASMARSPRWYIAPEGAPHADCVQASRDWTVTRSFIVRPVWVQCRIALRLAQYLRSHRAAGLVSLFLGDVLDHAVREAQQSTLHADRSQLRRCSPHVPRHRKRHKCSDPDTDPSDAAVGDLRILQRCRGEAITVLVIAVASEQLDHTAISTSLDRFSWFAAGDADGANRGRLCWHALRVHHRCRLLFPPEAACERLGSIMASLWHSSQGLAPGPLVDRVFLSQAPLLCYGIYFLLFNVY